MRTFSGRSFNRGSPETVMRVGREFTVGDEVRFRDNEAEAWRYGTITKTSPDVKFRGKPTPKTHGSDFEWSLSNWKMLEKVDDIV